jgi:hypothetical protein
MQSTASSLLMPLLPPPPLGMVSTMVASPSWTCSVRNVRSAFGCSPYTSGDSCPGRTSTKARNVSISLPSGTR